jgi:hypothetical protein
VHSLGAKRPARRRDPNRREAEVSAAPSSRADAAAAERQRERRAGAVRHVLDRLEAGVRAGACSDPSKSRGIDNTASPVEAAAVDQRRNACPVGERTVASLRHDGREPQPRPRPGRLVLKTRPDSVAVTGRCSCFAAGEQQHCCSLEPARRCFRSAGPRQERFGLRAVIARLVQRDNAQTGEPRAPNPWQSSRVGWTRAGDCVCDAADLKEKSDLEPTARVAQLVVRENGSLRLFRRGARRGRGGRPPSRTRPERAVCARGRRAGDRSVALSGQAFSSPPEFAARRSPGCRSSGRTAPGWSYRA